PFLHRHASLFRPLPRWTLRLLVPDHLTDAAPLYEAAWKEEFGTPLRLSTADELRWYFEERRRLGEQETRRSTVTTGAMYGRGMGSARHGTGFCTERGYAKVRRCSATSCRLASPTRSPLEAERWRRKRCRIRTCTSPPWSRRDCGWRRTKGGTQARMCI